MKKFGFVVLGLVLAVGVSAQPQQPPHHEQGDNKANLNQFGFSQWGFISQYGEDNKATINQGFLFTPHEAMPIMNPTWSFGNTAFIMQIGEDHEATINQVGHGNLAVLTQMSEMPHPSILGNGPHHEGAEGVITQWGSHNITSILQLQGSEVNIMQGGTHNFIGGYEHMPRGGFCAPLPEFSYEQACPMQPAMFPTLVVDEGVTVNLTQTGQGEYFFGIGKIKGDRKISQGNTLWNNHPDANNNNHHNELDFNAIWLEQAGGFADLTQNGKYNRMWIDIDVEGNHGPHVANGEPEHHGPYVKVTQIGYKNLVAKFSGPCAECCEGPAEFNGDHLIVLQNGYKNKLSIDSKGEGNNITVNQIGMYNYGSIVQGGMMPHHP